MAKLAVYTIGCKVNQGESEELKIALAEMGHNICREPAEADLCVVNTCTVTAESDHKCRKLIRRLGRQGARAIVAAGCYAQISPKDLRGLPAVVRVIPNSEKDNWSLELSGMLPDAQSGKSQAGLERSRGFIKVQDGCDRRCSYCIVPDARGGERSRPLSEVLDISGRWLEKGGGELVLCGINLGRYSLGPDFDIARLVREVTSLGDNHRVRLSSIEIEDLKYQWLEEWSRSGRVCPQMHLPLQSGDEAILEDMGRGYGPGDFINAVRALREAWPKATLTTEVMVGYPGESEEAFRRTLEVLEEVRPSRVHVFRFSPRPGTRALEKDGGVSPQIMQRRSALLRGMAEGWRQAYARSRQGTICELLVEQLVEMKGEMVAVGTTEDYIKAFLIDPPRHVRKGALVKAGINGLSGGKALLRAPGRDGPKRGIIYIGA